LPTANRNQDDDSLPIPVRKYWGADGECCLRGGEKARGAKARGAKEQRCTSRGFEET
jgi:hypothetical protein